MIVFKSNQTYEFGAFEPLKPAFSPLEQLPAADVVDREKVRWEYERERDLTFTREAYEKLQSNRDGFIFLESIDSKAVELAQMVAPEIEPLLYSQKQFQRDGNIFVSLKTLYEGDRSLTFVHLRKLLLQIPVPLATGSWSDIAWDMAAKGEEFFTSLRQHQGTVELRLLLGNEFKESWHIDTLVDPNAPKEEHAIGLINYSNETTPFALQYDKVHKDSLSKLMEQISRSSGERDISFQEFQERILQRSYIVRPDHGQMSVHLGYSHHDVTPAIHASLVGPGLRIQGRYSASRQIYDNFRNHVELNSRTLSELGWL